MDTLFISFLNMSIAAGWLILAIIIIRFALHKAPKWIRCALWGLVGLRLVFPFSIESVLSLIPSKETVSPDIIYDQTPSISSGIAVLNRSVNPIISDSLSPNVGDSINPLQVVVAVATSIWIMGMIAMCIYTAVSYLRLRKNVETAICLRDNIWQSENVQSPFILGLFHPRIYLPFHKSESSIQNALAHENMHLKRCDHLIKPFAFLLLTVYWFNPIIWLAYILLSRDIEMACDESVIKKLNERERKDYSEALLLCGVRNKHIVACPVAFGEIGVKERVKNVMHYKKPAFWIILVAVLALILVALCFLTNPKQTKNIKASVFDRNYSVESIVYSAGQYDFSYTLDTAPNYRITDDGQLMSLGEMTSTDWTYVGDLQLTDLNETNFDHYFRNQEIWDGMSASVIREENKQMWQVVVLPKEGSNEGIPPIFYDILLQDNGDVYLTYGYYDVEHVDNYEANTSSIRWVFKLQDDESTSTVSEEVTDTEGINDSLTNDTSTSEVGDVDASGVIVAEADDSKEGFSVDDAVTRAILEQNKSQKSSGNFCCESHITLATEEGKSEGADYIDTITIYAMVLYQEYLIGDAIIEISGSHIPTAITFHVSEAGNYTLQEYWIPRDGSYYTDDIYEKFPAEVANNALDTQIYIMGQMQNCYEQAVEYGEVNTEKVIWDNLQTICSKAHGLSAPGGYIEAHYVEYRELLYYNKYTLDYCFNQFLEGGQTDLRGAVMALACKEIMTEWGEESLDGELTATGQEWFDLYLANVQKLSTQIEDEEIEKHYPAAWILLKKAREIKEYKHVIILD